VNAAPAPWELPTPGEGHGDDTSKKLEELGRKVDELIREGKIRPAAAGGVRQAVTRFSAAVQRAG
jgi:hypothetical protein